MSDVTEQYHQIQCITKYRVKDSVHWNKDLIKVTLRL